MPWPRRTRRESATCRPVRPRTRLPRLRLPGRVENQNGRRFGGRFRFACAKLSTAKRERCCVAGDETAALRRERAVVHHRFAAGMRRCRWMSTGDDGRVFAPETADFQRLRTLRGRCRNGLSTTGVAADPQNGDRSVPQASDRCAITMSGCDRRSRRIATGTRGCPQPVRRTRALLSTAIHRRGASVDSCRKPRISSVCAHCAGAAPTACPQPAAMETAAAQMLRALRELWASDRRALVAPS